MGSPIEEHFQSGNEEERYYRCEGEEHKKKIGNNIYCNSKRIDSFDDPREEEAVDWSGSEHNSWSFDCSNDVAITEGTGSNKKTFCKKIGDELNSGLELNSSDNGNTNYPTKSAQDPEEEESEKEENESFPTTSGKNSINKINEEENDNSLTKLTKNTEEDDDNYPNTTQVSMTEEEEEEEEDEEDEEEVEEEFTGSMNIEHFSGKQIQQKVLNLNLLLKSLLFACLFYIVAHPDTKTYLLKNLKFLKGIDFLIVSMIIYFVCYYIISIFV